MRTSTTIALVFAIVAPVLAEQARTRSWGELSQEVQPDWTLRIVLPDSTEIQGKQAVFTPEALTLKIVKTSDAKKHPKGQIAIPREQVKTLDIRKNGMKFRIIGLLVPLAAGAALGAHTGSDKQQLLSGVAGAIEFGVVGVLGGSAGFFLGRAADRRFHSLTVKP